MKYYFILDNKKHVSIILYNRRPIAKIQIKVGVENECHVATNFAITFLYALKQNRFITGVLLLFQI